MPLPIIPFLTPLAISIASAMGFRNTNKSTETNKELAKKQQENQLKLAELNIQAQKNIEGDRQAFQERMARLGFAQQISIREYEHEFQLRLRQLDYQQQQEIEKFRATVSVTINQKNLDFQAWKFQQEIALQRELAMFNRETQFVNAAYQRETALATIETNRIYDNWPLNIYPSQILKSHPNHLRIFISPPELDYDRFINFTDTDKRNSSFKIENFLGSRLLTLLNQHYPRNDSLRPTQLLDGAWDSERYRGSASIVALAGLLESEPFVVLDTKVTLNRYLSLMVAYKGVGQNNYFYDEIIPRFDYNKILRDSAKARNDKEICIEDWEILYELLETAHCIVAAWIADVHHLLYYNAQPLLPQILPDLIKNLPKFMLADEKSIFRALLQEIIQGYQELFHQLTKTDRYYQVPELLINLAQSVIHFDDKSLLTKLADNSMRSWLEIRGIEGKINSLSTIVTKSDTPYLIKLAKVYQSIDNLELSIQLTEIVTSLQSRYEPIQRFVY